MAVSSILKMRDELAALRTRTAPAELDFASLPTPAFILDEQLLVGNLRLLQAIAEASGAKILLAQKAYSLYNTYPLIAKYLEGAAASGYQEARLARQYMDREVQVYSPAFSEAELEKTLPLADKLIFNRLSQIHRALPAIRAEQARRSSDYPLEIGLRINPEYSEVETDLYNPAAPGSRLGTNRELFEADLASLAAEGLDRAAALAPIDGFHFHCLCEQNFQPLKHVVEAVEEKFGEYLSGLKWLNFGGGHHLTRADYELDLLIPFLKDFKARYNLSDLYLEPGEAIPYDAGWLVTEVLDFQPSKVNNAILNTSATCHTPDVLEMPYRPRLFLYRNGRQYLADEGGVLAHSYRLGSASCLAGDSFGDYSFELELRRGDRLVFCDMALYTHVKTTMFNGMEHPDLIFLRAGEREPVVLKHFAFADFEARLGNPDYKL
ncbi:MAG: carboxynorspermidine decarboxylase [Eubacteriales bacterium]|nr:carboxynorspermidine decarboxylase [Eubacteriales bacterium]